MAKVNAATIRSQFATLGTRLEGAKGGFVLAAIGVAAFAVAWLGPLGIGGSYFLDRKKNKIIADRQMDVLADHLRPQIAARLNMDPTRVNGDALKQAAARDPRFAMVVKQVEQDQANSNRTNNLVNGGAMALGGFVPGLSGLSHMGAHLAVAVGGSAVSTMFNHDTVNVRDMMQFVDDKRAQGQPLTAHDVVLLQIAHDEAWQAAFKAKHGFSFHKADTQQQRDVINRMPELKQAQELADRVNAGQMTTQELALMTGTANDNEAAANDNSGWAARVGGPRARSGSFVAGLNAERAAQGPREV